MSDLQNPLFEEEKEFLERKKLEYERALRGDVDHIKDQSVIVGKVALVGAGLVGGIWLLSKALGGKKKKRNRYAADERDYQESDAHEDDHDDHDSDDEFGADYFTAGNGKRYRSKEYHKSAAHSAQAFMAAEAEAHEADDLGFGGGALQAGAAGHAAEAGHGATFDDSDYEDDPFQDLPYDDSRRLPASHAFDGQGEYAPVATGPNSRSKMIGAVLQSFLQSDTGKVLVGQVAAVALALVTKKVSEFFPADKNADLAASPGYASAQTGFSPGATPASPDFPDASTHPQSS